MKNDLESPAKPAALPLIRSIARELRERCLRILLLQTLLETPLGHKSKRLLVAEIAANRRGLRLARGEMERTGFSIVAMDPLRVCVQDQRGTHGALLELGNHMESRNS